MPTLLTPPPLESVLQQLHDSEINAGVQTFYDAGMLGLDRRRGQRHPSRNDDQSDSRRSPQVAGRVHGGELAA